MSYLFSYEVRRTVITHQFVTVTVTEAELDSMTHAEIEQKALKACEELDRPVTKRDEYVRADLINREKIGA